MQAIKKLARLYDPWALCAGLARILVEQGDPCAHDFGHTRALLAECAPDVDIEAVVTTLIALGAECDCEVGYNVCALLEE